MTRTPTWRDGTPKSIHNAFTGHLDGTPSILAEDRSCKTWKDGKTQSQYMQEAVANKTTKVFSRAGA
jgi:hypothetical protein